MEMKHSAFLNKRCWISSCSFSSFQEITLLSLPEKVEIRESWLALAGKQVGSFVPEEIKFCEKHFLDSDIVRNANICCANGLPLLNMPDKICRTCMVIIPDNKKFYVISDSIITDVPKYVEEMMSPCISGTPTPLSTILKATIPEIDIRRDPPSLMCNECFQNIWLYYMYKLSSVQNENTLRGKMSLSDYGKMVICRCCPKIFGVKLFEIEDDSSKGLLLKAVFGTKNLEPNTLPLRVCDDCYNILQKLDEFRNKCLMVDAKLRRHISLEQDIEKRKSCSALPQVDAGTSRVIQMLKNSVQKYLDNHQDFKERCSPLDKEEDNISRVTGDIRANVSTNRERMVDKQGTTSKDHRDAGSITHSSHGTDDKNRVTGDIKVKASRTRIVDKQGTTSKDHRKAGIISYDSAILDAYGADDKNSSSSGRKKRKQRRKSGAGKKFSFDDKKILIEEVRDEYARLETQGTLTKFPWQTIIRNLADRGVLQCSYEKLNSVFSRLRMSAKIYEKNGQDMIDVELWELLEHHRKQVKFFRKLEAEKEPKLVTGNAFIESTSTAKETPVIAKEESIEQEDDGDKIKIETTNNSELEVPNKKLKLQLKWSENDKFQICKLIKNEFELMLKNNEPLGRSWSKIIKRVIEKGYVEWDEAHLSYVWSRMRQSLMQHENTPNMTPLDWKVWRLLKRRKQISILSEPSQNKKELVNTFPSNRQKSTSYNDNFVKTRWTHQQKTDLIMSAKKFGNAVFKKRELQGKEPIWPKIFKEFHTSYGHNMSNSKIRTCWNNMIKSATLAMGDHKKKSEIDNILIEFMKSIAENKTAGFVSDVETESHICQSEVPAKSIEKIEPITENISNETADSPRDMMQSYQNTAKENDELLPKTQNKEAINDVDGINSHEEELLAAISSIQRIHETESFDDIKNEECSVDEITNHDDAIEEPANNASEGIQNEQFVEDGSNRPPKNVSVIVSTCENQENEGIHLVKRKSIESHNEEGTDNPLQEIKDAVINTNDCQNKSDDETSSSTIIKDENNEESDWDSDDQSSSKYQDYKYVSRKDIESQLEDTKYNFFKIEENSVIEVSSDSETDL